MTLVRDAWPAPGPTPTPADAGRLAEFVRAHRRLFVLTGAGVSTAAGIPDYRDADGNWKRRAPVQYGPFVRDEAVRRRYWARSALGWPGFARSRPAPGHVALVDLERAGRVAALVTQNVDGLHQRAGSRTVLDLHGRLDAVVCLDCGARSRRATLQRRLIAMNPEFATRSAPAAPDGDADLDGADLSAFRIPACEACGGTLKPDVVFFGESVPRPRVAAAFSALDGADAVLVAGSSLMVWSGYRFVRAAVHAGKPVAAVNLGRTRADDALALKIETDVGAALAAVAGALSGPADADSLTPRGS